MRPRTLLLALAILVAAALLAWALSAATGGQGVPTAPGPAPTILT